MLKRTAHTTYDLKYHFVWVPKYRKRVLDGDRGRYLKYLLVRIEREYGFRIVEVAVAEDHVHLFMEVPPKYSPARVMETVKSITGREMFRRFPELGERLWAGKLWADGYYVSSVGDAVTEETVKRYITSHRSETII